MMLTLSPPWYQRQVVDPIRRELMIPAPWEMVAVLGRPSYRHLVDRLCAFRCRREVAAEMRWVQAILGGELLGMAVMGE